MDTKWQHSQSRFPDFQTSMTNKQDEKSSKYLCMSYDDDDDFFHVDRGSDASSISLFPVNAD